MLLFKLPKDLHLTSTRMGWPTVRACVLSQNKLAIAVGRHDQKFAVAVFNESAEVQSMSMLGTQQLHSLACLDEHSLFACHLWANSGLIRLGADVEFQPILNSKDEDLHDVLRLQTGEFVVGSRGVYTDSYGSCLLRVYPSGQFEVDQAKTVVDFTGGRRGGRFGGKTTYTSVVDGQEFDFSSDLIKKCRDRGATTYSLLTPEIQRMFDFSDGQILFSVHSPHKSGATGAAIATMDLNGRILAASAMESNSLSETEIEFDGQHIFSRSENEWVVRNRNLEVVARFHETSIAPFKGFTMIGSSPKGHLVLYSSRTKSICWLKNEDLIEISSLPIRFAEAIKLKKSL